MDNIAPQKTPQVEAIEIDGVSTRIKPLEKVSPNLDPPRQWNEKNREWWDGTHWRKVNPDIQYPTKPESLVIRVAPLLALLLMPLFALTVYGAVIISQNAAITVFLLCLAFVMFWLWFGVYSLVRGGNQTWKKKPGGVDGENETLSEMSERIRKATPRVFNTNLYHFSPNHSIFREGFLATRPNIRTKIKDSKKIEAYPTSFCIANMRGDVVLYGESSNVNQMLKKASGKQRFFSYVCVASLKGKHAIPQTKIIPNAKAARGLKSFTGKSYEEDGYRDVEIDYTVNDGISEHPIMNKRVMELLIEAHKRNYSYYISGGLLVVVSSNEDTTIENLYSYTVQLQSAIPVELYR